MTENVTMGSPAFGSKHRELSVERVENGYRVHAKFYIERTGHDGTKHDSSEWLDYVFYTEVEMLDWIKAYFGAPLEEIGKGD